MKQVFCETVIKEIMPAVRAAIAIRMLELGFTQEEISRKLGITQPAISQYKQRLRGGLFDDLHRNKAMNEYIDRLIDEITKKDANLNTKLCSICATTRRGGVVSVSKKDFLCLLTLNDNVVN